MKLNLGAGKLHFKGFKNVDYPEIDLRKPLQFEDLFSEEIRLIHVLEHLRWDHAVKLVGECFRVLAPRGRLIVECPDIVKCYKVAASLDELNSYIYGDPRNSTNGNELEYHRWGWTSKALMDLFYLFPFSAIKSLPAEYHGRPDRDILIEGIK